MIQRFLTDPGDVVSRGNRTKLIWSDSVFVRLCVLQDGFVQNVHIPIVRVDPENRCAVMLVYGTQLVVLPFRKDTLTDEQDGIVGEGYRFYLNPHSSSVCCGRVPNYTPYRSCLLQAEVQFSPQLHH